MKALIALIVVAALAAAGYWYFRADAPKDGRPDRWGGGAAVVAVEPVSRHLFVRQVEAIGTARANESVTITAKLTDKVSQVNFDDGDQVEAGDVLVEMANQEQEALLAEARANLNDARQRLGRVRDLGKRGLAADSEVDQAEAAAKAAEARLDTVLARLQDRVVRAPFSGVLGFRQVSRGTLLSPGTPITTLDDVSVIKLDFTVPETLLSTVVPGSPVTAHSEAWGERSFEGTVRSVSSRVDPVTRAVEVRALIENEDGALRPGMLMTVLVATDQRESLAVRQGSLLQVSDQNYVFTVDEQNRAWRREVELGQRTYELAEVLGGLEEGELVVVEGLIQLRDGMQVELKEDPPTGQTLSAAAPGL